MDNFFSRYKDLLVLVVVLFGQFIGLAMQIRHPLPNGQDRHNVRLWRFWVVALVAPPEKILHNMGAETRGFFSDYVDLRDTRAENQRLLEEVNRLHLEEAGLMEDARQGQRLQSLLSFKEQYVYKTVPAEVIGTAGTDQSRVLYINKGSKDGLAPEMPVITPNGVVGRLKDVFPHTAQLLVINDQTSGAGVLLQTTRLRGVLRGNAFGQPQIINILPDERIKPGEQVVTSGGDQIFPRGLPVGTVEKVVEDPANDPYVDVVIKPAANLAHLEEVLVVTETSDQMTDAAKRDMIKSQAAAAVDADKQRAADILAEKLPGYVDPSSPEDADSGASAGTAADGEIGRPIQPLKTLHPDKYSPDAAPAASSLRPGEVVPHATVASNSNGDGMDAGARQRMRAREGDAAAGVPGNETTPRPKTVKPKAPPAAEAAPAVQAAPQAMLRGSGGAGGRG